LVKMSEGLLLGQEGDEASVGEGDEFLNFGGG
jgi:hypothetical protein